MERGGVLQQINCKWEQWASIAQPWLPSPGSKETCRPTSGSSITLPSCSCSSAMSSPKSLSCLGWNSALSLDNTWLNCSLERRGKGMTLTAASHKTLLCTSQHTPALVRCANCLSALIQTACPTEVSCSHKSKTIPLPSSASPRASLVHRPLCTVSFPFCLLGPCHVAWGTPLSTVETLGRRAPCNCERGRLFRRAFCGRPGKRRCRPAQSRLGSRTVFTFFLPGSLCGGRVFGCSSRGWLNLKPGEKQTQAGRQGFTFPWLPVTEMAGSHCKLSSFPKQHIQAVHHLGGLGPWRTPPWTQSGHCVTQPRVPRLPGSPSLRHALDLYRASSVPRLIRGSAQQGLSQRGALQSPAASLWASTSLLFCPLLQGEVIPETFHVLESQERR